DRDRDRDRDQDQDPYHDPSSISTLVRYAPDSDGISQWVLEHSDMAHEMLDMPSTRRWPWLIAVLAGLAAAAAGVWQLY
ncbi:MAG: hypothetical protein AAGC55_06820, partial [Myxococcota bacterium]